MNLEIVGRKIVLPVSENGEQVVVGEFNDKLIDQPIEELKAILSNWGEIESNVQRLLASDLITFSSNFEELEVIMRKFNREISSLKRSDHDNI